MTTRYGDGFLQGTQIRQGREAADANARAGEAARARDERNYKADRDDARNLAAHREEQNRLELLRIQNQNNGGGGASPEEVEQLRVQNAEQQKQFDELNSSIANGHALYALEGFSQTGDFGYMQRGFSKPGVREALEEIGVSDMMPVDWENDGQLLSSVGFSYKAMQNKKFRDAASREYFKYKKDGEWAISSIESTAQQFGLYKDFSQATLDQRTKGLAAINAAWEGDDLQHEQGITERETDLAETTQDDVRDKNESDAAQAAADLAEEARQANLTDENTDNQLKEDSAANLADERLRQDQLTLDRDIYESDIPNKAAQADAALTTARAALINAETTSKNGDKKDPTVDERNFDASEAVRLEAYKAVGANDSEAFYGMNFDRSTKEGKANYHKVWQKLLKSESLVNDFKLSDGDKKNVRHIDIMADLGAKAAGLKSGQVGWIDAWLRSAKDATWFSSPEGKAAVTAYETLRNRNRHILYGSAVVAGEATYAKSELDDLTAQPAKVLVQLRGAMQNQLSAIDSMVKTGHPQAMHVRMATSVATLNKTIQYITDRIDTLYPASAKPKPEATPPLDQGQIDAMNAAGKRQPNARGGRK